MKAEQEKKLFEAISKAKEAVNAGYNEIQTALMKRDSAREALKKKGSNYTADYYSSQWNEIQIIFNRETREAVDRAKEAVQNQKSVFMQVVTDFYHANAKNLDSDEVALLKSGILLNNDELFDMIMKDIDNVTMLRVIMNYYGVSRLPDMGKDEIMNKVPDEVQNIFIKVLKNGSVEERAFDRFVNLACAGFAHPSETYTLFQGRLDAYEEEAVESIKEARFITD